MRKRHMPDMKEGGVNVTPLIDIVMVLIVFFMLVAKIGVTRGEDKEITLPAALLGVNEMKDLSTTLTLNLRTLPSVADPQVTAMVGDKVRELHVSKETRSGSDQELRRVLEAFKNQFGDKATIIIHADMMMPYRQLQTVLIECAQAKIANVSYETSEGADPLYQQTGAAEAK